MSTFAACHPRHLPNQLYMCPIALLVQKEGCMTRAGAAMVFSRELMLDVDLTGALQVLRRTSLATGAPTTVRARKACLYKFISKSPLVFSTISRYTL